MPKTPSPFEKEVRITPEIDKLRDEFYRGLDAAWKDEMDAVKEYNRLADIADRLGYFNVMQALTRIEADEAGHVDIIYQIKEKMPGPYLKMRR